jgi:hypothetical protein
MSDNQDNKAGPADAAEPGEKHGKALNPLQVVSSVLAASLGVQSSKNRERDFKHGRIGVFIAAGIIFTLLFIGTVFTVVQVVLKGSGN